MLRISNIRCGFATNSSSSHSIILMDAKGIADDLPYGDGFGWEFFTAASKEAKLRYAAQAVFIEAQKLMGDEVAAIIAKELTGIDVRNEEGEREGYIDHQSEPLIPAAWDGKGLDMAYARDLVEFLTSDGVVILGGNDNTEETHSLYNRDKQVLFPTEASPTAYRARKDGNNWTIFNKHDGSKFRISFKGDKGLKAIAPELVDLKITDFCDIGCPFCYQDSTKQGVHAPKDRISSILYGIGNWGLHAFEVAIGGGEPTQHPDFHEIIEICAYLHIVPNFTTKTLDWLKHAKAGATLEACGGFAYSVGSAVEATRVEYEFKKAFPAYSRKLNFQYVMGSTPMAEFAEILKTAGSLGVPITLLGYKQVGRGPAFKPHDYSLWGEVVKELKGKLWRLGIDTQLAAESAESLKLLNIPSYLYSVKEGAHSMYIDAVAQKMAPSSYCDKNLYVPLPQTGHGANDFANEVRMAFAGW